MVMNRHRDKIEVIAPTDARAVDIKKLRSLGAVHINMRSDRTSWA
jgi:hypothetical protein